MDAHPIRTDPLVGALLDGRYRVVALIATGGMSAVYRGVDERLDRPVAIKVVDTRYAGDQQFLTRFQLEARSAARLKHPGLVAVYDQGRDSAHPFLVMELVEGGTLRELLRERGPMPPHAVAAVMRPVLGGLAAAHRNGLVHRDVKPENVLISDDGEVKIADFGLVRAVAEAGITSASVILGTAAYLSPEQVSTGTASPRSDVYAAGVLIYELLTGTTPFTGDTALALAYQRLDHDVPAPSSVISGVPPLFDELVGRATARLPADRYADAHEMGEDLAAIVDELGLPDFRVPAPRSSALHTSAALHFKQQHTPPPPSAPPPPPLAPPLAPSAPPPPLSAPPPYTATRALERDAARLSPAPPQSHGVTGQFAGINLDEFYWARQRSKRMVWIWVSVVLIVAGMVAAGAWMLGSNIGALL